MQSPDFSPAASSIVGSDLGAGKANDWQTRYGKTHQLRRITDFPPGTRSLRRVRIYSRQHHFVIQWWDPQARRNLNERVNGDLIDAIGRAREIDARLENFKSAGQGPLKLGTLDMVECYLQDLRRRANAGQVSVATIARYGSALGHFRQFADQPPIRKAFPFASGINRDFQLAFAAHLEQLQISPNGHPNARRRALRGQTFILDCVRSMFEWGSDPSRGNMLPDGFRNPFVDRNCTRRTAARDQFGQPDINAEMAAQFFAGCDEFQLALFGPILLYGLRATEPTNVFCEHVDSDWFKVICVPELDYLTKGKRDKRFPMIAIVKKLLVPRLTLSTQGLLFTRRGSDRSDKSAPLFGTPLTALADEFQRRCAAERVPTAGSRQQIAAKILRAAGGLNYDGIQHEFCRVTRQLNWPPEATLKDFRHLFSTCLENTGMPEHYRLYLMGHSPGRSAIVTYTHFNALRERFEEALQREFGPIVAAIEARGQQLGLFGR